MYLENHNNDLSCGTLNNGGTDGTKFYSTNGTKLFNRDHEESPDSNDSAYDSEYRKRSELIFPPGPGIEPETLDPSHHHNFFSPACNLSKSSSLVMMNLDCDSNMDNVSNASTIKNQHFRDESISYDTVLR